MSRNRACKKCGEFVFNINPMYGSTEIICNKCKSIYYISCGEYTTCDKTCSSCYNDLFRLKTIDYGDSEKMTLECIQCKGSPRTYYIDKEGSTIDRSTREILIIGDRVEKIENSVSNLESRIYEIEYKTEFAEDDIDRLNSRITNSKDDISSIEQDVDWLSKELDIEVNRLKEELGKLNGLVSDLEKNISNLK